MLGVGSIPWSPLARGLLTRPSTTKSAREDTDPAIRMYSPESRSDIVMRYELNFLSAHQDRFTKTWHSVEQVAKSHGASMAQVGLAWLLSKDGALVFFARGAEKGSR
jgi:aryl-alcohol dehydrogenase-like predicted oxidoreductase